MGDPVMTCFSVGSNDPEINIQALADVMDSKGKIICGVSKRFCHVSSFIMLTLLVILTLFISSLVQSFRGDVLVVLRRFQQSFSHITTVTAFCTRHYSARVLSAAYSDATCHRHKPRMHYQFTLSWHRANQIWFYPLNAERLTRKQPILTSLDWSGRARTRDLLTTCSRRLSVTRPPSRSV